MKITDLKVFYVHSFVYVKIETDEGVHGLGEASLSGRGHAVIGALKHLRPVLIGQDATRIEHIWQDIFRGTFWRAGPVLQSALAGIDIALWDLNAKALGVPSYRLLGGATRDKVLVYRHVGGATPEQLVANSKALLSEGYRALRISPITGHNDGFDAKLAILNGAAHMQTLREGVGEQVEIIFEAHTRLTTARAIELCNRLADSHPWYVEDPIRSENPGSFATLRAHTDVAIGTGEQLTTKWAFRELIEQELIDFIRVDICHSGGITEGNKLATMAEVHYQELACHYTGSPVSTAAMLHLNLSIPNCAVQEYGPHSEPIGRIIDHDLEAVDGHLLRPQAPGLGIDIDEEAARAAEVADGEPPHWRRPDGSVNDW
ncbi:MAG: galactonate dehydratase [Candidatus Latescibacterota bacterium]|nr:galactonate dehydratase [Candidatus Latescibacterota bacterium]